MAVFVKIILYNVFFSNHLPEAISIFVIPYCVSLCGYWHFTAVLKIACICRATPLDKASIAFFFFFMFCSHTTDLISCKYIFFLFGWIVIKCEGVSVQ